MESFKIQPHRQKSCKVQSKSDRNRGKSIPLTQIYMAAHIPGLVRALQ